MMLKQVLQEKVCPGSVAKGTKNTSDLKFRSKRQLGEKEVKHHLKGEKKNKKINKERLSIWLNKISALNLTRMMKSDFSTSFLRSGEWVGHPISLLLNLL